MSRNKAKKQAHNARMHAARGAKAAGFKMLVGKTAELARIAAGLNRRSASLHVDMDSGESITNPFRGSAEVLN